MSSLRLFSVYYDDLMIRVVVKAENEQEAVELAVNGILNSSVIEEVAREELGDPQVEAVMKGPLVVATTFGDENG